MKYIFLIVIFLLFSCKSNNQDVDKIIVREFCPDIEGIDTKYIRKLIYYSQNDSLSKYYEVKYIEKKSNFFSKKLFIQRYIHHNLMFYPTINYYITKNDSDVINYPSFIVIQFCYDTILSVKRISDHKIDIINHHNIDNKSNINFYLENK